VVNVIIAHFIFINTYLQTIPVYPEYILSTCNNENNITECKHELRYNHQIYQPTQDSERIYFGVSNGNGQNITSGLVKTMARGQLDANYSGPGGGMLKYDVTVLDEAEITEALNNSDVIEKILANSSKLI
jgi:hypothetical protein